MVKDFLDERYLKEYLAEYYKLTDLSNIKIEFIKKALKELLIAPVDIEHYELLIAQVKETGAASFCEGNEELFYQEIEGTLKKYIY